MAAQVPTTPVLRHIIGDLAFRAVTLATVADADTLTLPGVRDILWVGITANATAGGAFSPCASWTGSVITFHSGGSWSGSVAVISRVG